MRMCVCVCTCAVSNCDIYVSKMHSRILFFVCVCAHACVHTCNITHIYIHLGSGNIFVHVYILIHNVCMHALSHAPINTFLQVLEIYACICVCIHIYIYVYIYIYTHTKILTYTCILSIQALDGKQQGINQRRAEALAQVLPANGNIYIYIYIYSMCVCACMYMHIY